MAKKFTRKKNRLRNRARQRKIALKTNPVTKGLKPSVQQQNQAVLDTLESKVKAAVAAAAVA
jgi:hypothetical protein